MIDCGKHFKSLHQMKTCNYHHFKPILGIYDEILDGEISVNEIYTVLGQMKCGKAPGRDGLRIQIYKSLPPRFIQLLVNFWNE